MDKNTVFVIKNKESDIAGVIKNIDENNVSILWENDDEIQLTNEELEAFLESDEYEVGELVSEETPAQASIHTHSSADATDGDADGNPKTKLDWIRAIIGNMADMDMNSLVKIFNDQQAMVGGEGDRAGVGDKAKGNAASVAMKPSAAVSESVTKLQKEEMDSLFGETELTEEFKAKISTLFEATIVSRLTEEVVKIQEKYDAKLQENVDALTSELVENLDSYLDHVSSEWLEENKVAVESTLRTELTLSFLDNLKNLFQEHYITVPEERVDVYENLVASNEKTKKEYNKVVNENMEKDKVIKGFKKNLIVSESAVGLTLPQREKLKALTEATEFENEEAFTKKVKTIKESLVVKVPATDSNILSENVEGGSNEITTFVDPEMKAYAGAVSRLAKK